MDGRVSSKFMSLLVPKVDDVANKMEVDFTLCKITNSLKKSAAAIAQLVECRISRLLALGSVPKLAMRRYFSLGPSILPVVAASLTKDLQTELKKKCSALVW